MTFPDYEQYDALGLAELVRRRQVSPAELLEAAIERVEARNAAVNAVMMPLYDYGRAAIAAGLPDGPFTRRPVSHEGSHRVDRRRPDDAQLPLLRRRPAAAGRQRARHAAQARRAGHLRSHQHLRARASRLTCEPQLHGPTRNPWDLTRISGGSSGGAAAAVGARMLPMAHATDGFGSIRAPAACCGLVGLKPTRGRNTMAPVLGEGLGGLLGRARGDPVRARLRGPPRRDARRRAPAIPTSRRRRPDRSCRRSAPTRGAAHRLHSRRRTARRSRRSACARSRETARLCADLGHRGRGSRSDVDRAAVVPTFLTLAAANTVVNLAAIRRRAARRGPTRSRRHVGDGEARRAVHRRRLRARHPDRASARAADGRVPLATGTCC